MPDSILVLQLEHRKIGKVLGLMRRQLAQLQAELPVDRLMRESALDYLSGFPDQCHHPKENLVYHKLIERFPALAESLRELTAEHEALDDLTRGVRQALSDARLELPDGAGKLAGQMQEFLEFYELHIAMEEQHFFPIALSHLSRSDFEEIDFSLYERLDSELSQDAEASYGDLLAVLAQMGNLDGADGLMREDAVLLSGVHDLASFGAVLQKKGEAVKLAHSPAGGFTLVRDGQALLRIPACSEERAAWCAYYFLKGAAMPLAAGDRE
jgi:hemerythrin-like domain-containing protein